MEEERFQAFREDFALLIEAGFVAVKQLDEISATRIFHAAQVINPLSTAPQIGLGYIALNKLEVKQATKIFEAVIKQEPQNYLAQTFLGMSLLLTPQRRKKGVQIIRDAMEKTDDPTVKNLGEVSLEWAEKELLKKDSEEKSPFFVAQSTEKKGTEGET